MTAYSLFAFSSTKLSGVAAFSESRNLAGILYNLKTGWAGSGAPPAARQPALKAMKMFLAG